MILDSGLLFLATLCILLYLHTNKLRAQLLLVVVQLNVEAISPKKIRCRCTIAYSFVSCSLRQNQKRRWRPTNWDVGQMWWKCPSSSLNSLSAADMFSVTLLSRHRGTVWKAKTAPPVGPLVRLWRFVSMPPAIWSLSSFVRSVFLPSRHFRLKAIATHSVVSATLRILASKKHYKLVRHCV